MTTTEWFGNDHPALRHCWHPIGWLHELDGPGPHPVALMGRHHALVRSGDGWHLLPDRCPHRLAPLTAGRLCDGILECAYHGWRFDGAGRCVAIPAIGDGPVPPSAHLEPAHAVVEHLGLVWVAIDEPLTPLPELPEWTDPTMGTVTLPVQTWRCGAAQMADNFLDVGHFPFTHTGTIGDPDDQMVGDYELQRDGWTFGAVHRHSARAMEADGTATVGRTMTFTCTAPHHIRLRLEYETGLVMVLTFFHQPVDAETTRLYSIEQTTELAEHPEREAETVAFQLRVAEEDRSLLEQLRTKAVPLGPGVETNTRADRITVELRRVLRELADATGGRP